MGSTGPESDITQYPKPLQLNGSLGKFSFEDTTPVIGREFIDVNIVDDLLNAPNADELLHDLAINISQRGVVFFRAQDNLTNDLQKDLVHRLGLLAGKPPSSTLHIHPTCLRNATGDREISTVNSVARKKVPSSAARAEVRRYDSGQWHADIQFEPCPANYTSLRLVKLPKTGGDTLWASGYELYDRFSPAYQKFLNGLTATFAGDGFLKVAEAHPELFMIYEKERGSSKNVGRNLRAVHPVIRTNPVTGWKSVYAAGMFPLYINELSGPESEALLKTFLGMITENHDLQVRFKWRNVNDIAIWDNRSVFHTATFDYDSQGDRKGNRTVGIGEVPFFDPSSKSRSEALGL